MTANPSARFDDLVSGTAQRFPEATSVLVAMRPDEVPAVLAEVERVTAAGSWAFGFVAYEAASALDPDLTTREPVPGLPLAWFGVATGPVDVPVVVPPTHRGYRAGPWLCDWDAGVHGEAVEEVRARIADGETYQANLTTRLRAHVDGDLEQLYTDLALGQRGAFNAYLDTGRFVIAGASPELFFDLRADRLTMRPMKGTAPRGRTQDEDAAAVAALSRSDKDRAENVMIVDLVRNDLGRIARTGSVTATALCRPERYETVHQLVSEITADVAPGVGLLDVFRALFPCGSVTGAPKARTMEIIRDLETAPRGVYCGAVGVVAPPGAPFRARFGVAIRTVLADRVTGEAVYGSGGGITWSSNAADEFAELRAKTAVLDARPEEMHLIETMRHDAATGLHLLDRHLDRMASSAEYFGFAFDPDLVRHALHAALAGAGDARIRLLAHRDGAFDIETAGLPPALGRPVRLAVDDEPIDSTRCWPQHKTSHREPYERRRARHPEADDVVLVNERGEVTEATTATVAARIDGRWWTPPVDVGCLPGVERADLIEAGELSERVLRPADLDAADAVALLNALRGWRPAELLRPAVASRATAP